MAKTTNRYNASAGILALDEPKGVEVEQAFAGMRLGANEQPGQMLFPARPQAAAMQHYSWTNNRQPVIWAGPAGPPE